MIISKLHFLGRKNLGWGDRDGVGGGPFDPNSKPAILDFLAANRPIRNLIHLETRMNLTRNLIPV